MTEDKAPELVEQPKPLFTLEELGQKLSAIYTRSLNATQWTTPESTQGLKEANGMLQELIAIVDKHVRDIQPIDVKMHTVDVIQEAFRQEQPDHYVCGVQLIENKRLTGTSLYTTVFKARTIRDILNKRFAELKVDHEAKIVNYPVF